MTIAGFFPPYRGRSEPTRLPGGFQTAKIGARSSRRSQNADFVISDDHEASPPLFDGLRGKEGLDPLEKREAARFG
jgi:hypothetical protein